MESMRKPLKSRTEIHRPKPISIHDSRAANIYFSPDAVRRRRAEPARHLPVSGGCSRRLKLGRCSGDENVMS
jgi:hypothetical protein